jgi:cellulose synthase/poly-beta-1,6-N-acetylglucosamine synthase-like glycosyltransferase
MERDRSQPTVSVLLPVRDEAAHITECLESLLGQDHPVTEILIADGGSTDGTRDILTRLAVSHPVVRVLDNPQRRQSYGLNLLLGAARGEIVVRADAHTTYPADYVRRCVAALASSGADLVGGAMLPQGVSPLERAIAAAMTSPLAMGGARFRRAGGAGESDTVYLGAAATATLRRHGGYRHLPSGVAEDADLAQRIRSAGGRVWLDPAIRSSYRPRSTLRALWRQFRRYGRGKGEMLHLNRRFPSLRPLLPLGLAAAVGAGLGAGVAGWSWWPLVVVMAVWVAAIIAAAISSPHPVRTAAAVVVMHLSYVIGLVAGLLRGRSAVSPMRSAHPSPDVAADDLHRNPEHG